MRKLCFVWAKMIKSPWIKINLIYSPKLLISEAPTIPVHNLYTVDAYQTVPGGVLLNEPLPSNQYYGGKIGERREAPTGKSYSVHERHSEIYPI